MTEDDELILIALPWGEFDFIDKFDPDRDRSASRAEMVAVLEYIQVCVREGREVAR